MSTKRIGAAETARCMAAIVVLCSCPIVSVQAAIGVSWVSVPSLTVDSPGSGEPAPIAATSAAELRTDLGPSGDSFLLYKLPEGSSPADYLVSWRARHPDAATDLYVAPDTFTLPVGNDLQHCEVDCPGTLLSSIFAGSHPENLGFWKIPVSQLDSGRESVSGLLANYGNSQYFAMAAPGAVVFASPEPGTLALLAIGALMVIGGLMSRRRTPRI